MSLCNKTNNGSTVIGGGGGRRLAVAAVATGTANGQPAELEGFFIVFVQSTSMFKMNDDKAD